MYAPDPLQFAHRTQSFAGNPTAAPGVAITGGNSNADGTAVAIIGTALTHDVELLEVIILCSTATAQSAVDTSMILDLLVDKAGGTSWDTTNLFIEGLFAGYLGASAGTTFASRRWKFPVWLPAGTTIAGRARSTVASGNTAFLVQLIARGGVNRPEQWWCGQLVDAIGINRAASGGTTVAPSASANTYGSWTSIGSATARRYGALLPSSCIIGAAVTGPNRQFQIGNDSTQRGPTFSATETATESATDSLEDSLVYADIPEGTQLQARVRSGSASGSSDQFIIHGVA
jgi:hypothetical protein